MPNSIPDFQSLLLPLLTSLGDKQEHSPFRRGFRLTHLNAL
jgi:hypothetical protein